MSQLKSLVRANPVPTMRLLAWVIMIIVACGVGWAAVAHLDEVHVAEGEIVPKGQVRVIQHLEGVIIREIFVAEGDDVSAGAPLIQISLAVSDVNRDEIQIRLDGLILQRARLEAEASGADLTLPESEADRLRDVARSEKQTFAARRNELESTLSVLRSQMEQRDLEIREFESKGPRDRSGTRARKLCDVSGPAGGGSNTEDGAPSAGARGRGTSG